MEKKRIVYLDVAKGILILLLVFAHFRSAIARVPFESDYFSWVYEWNNIFTCFYMPAFFFISGYCSNFCKPPRVFFTSLTKNLLLPLIALNVIDVMLSSAVNQQNLAHNLFVNVTQYGGLWFLNALLVGKLINYFVAKAPKHSGGGYFIAIVSDRSCTQPILYRT
jgi:fucose 4-O-acetylase-like acetyltransferase